MQWTVLLSLTELLRSDEPNLRQHAALGIG